MIQNKTASSSVVLVSDERPSLGGPSGSPPRRAENNLCVTSPLNTSP